jgi:hypothetical protein
MESIPVRIKANARRILGVFKVRLRDIIYLDNSGVNYAREYSKMGGSKP